LIIEIPHNREDSKSQRTKNPFQLYEKLLLETPGNKMAFVEISSNSAMSCSVYQWHHACFSEAGNNNFSFFVEQRDSQESKFEKRDLYKPE